MQAISCPIGGFYAFPLAFMCGGQARLNPSAAWFGRRSKSNKQAKSMRVFQYLAAPFFGRITGRYCLAVSRFGSGIHIPRHAGSLAVLALLGGFASYGMVAGGHMAESLKLAGSGVGLGVNKVQISGNRRVSEIDVLQALGLDGDISLPVLDAAAAQRALEAMPWVEKASVRKVYPDRLEIKLTERKPYAVWQKNGAIDIVDGQGRIIVPYNKADGRGLPFFVGRGAENHARDFLLGMQNFPDLRARARAYIRVADRRWDILLDNGLRIKLPEHGAFARLAAAAALDRREGLFSRDITDVDLRLNDRITVALGPEALARRAQAVKQAEKQEKALKNGRQA